MACLRARRWRRGSASGALQEAPATGLWEMVVSRDADTLTLRGRPERPGRTTMTATRLGLFIQQNMRDILCEWELFAKTRIPAAATMSIPELRDHAEEMLRAIAQDLGRSQTEAERSNKSKCFANATEAEPTGASAHGARQDCPLRS